MTKRERSILNALKSTLQAAKNHGCTTMDGPDGTGGWTPEDVQELIDAFKEYLSNS